MVTQGHMYDAWWPMTGENSANVIMHKDDVYGHTWEQMVKDGYAWVQITIFGRASAKRRQMRLENRRRWAYSDNQKFVTEAC